MNNKELPLDIYLLGIGGTGMGAFAGLLKQQGHRVFGSDSAIYSPMKEKLLEWGIEFVTPYHEKNLPAQCDLVIIGNVIRRDNAEAVAIVDRNLPFDSFPRALNRFFLKDAIPLVISGTHGKTTCSALVSHVLFSAGCDPGFLIGGIPINFGESFRSSKSLNKPFVVEGDEYDTAYFDKRPKFIHYDPKYLLITSLEFDHADIYRDLDHVIDAFASLLKTLSSDHVVIINGPEKNIEAAINRSQCAAKIIRYGEGKDFFAHDYRFHDQGISFRINIYGRSTDEIFLPLFGHHNLQNAVGCFAMLHEFGLSFDEIKHGFHSFLGVKRRLEQRSLPANRIMIDDFAHHPSAVKETIRAAKQKYPGHKICAIFEPRSATSSMKIFENNYQDAFMDADHVLLAPVGRALPVEQSLDCEKIASILRARGVSAQACENYQSLASHLKNMSADYVLLFMSNGDFKGLLKEVDQIFC